MSNRGPHTLSPLCRALATLALISAGPSWAQSSALIDAIRVHRPDVAQVARNELLACEAQKPTCAEAGALGLLAGALTLSDGDAAQAAVLLLKTKPPKALRPFHGFYLGEAQSWSGEQVKALATLAGAKAGAPGWLSARIDARVAELQVALGQGRKAKAFLEKAASASPTPELLYTRALARLQSKDEAGAAADLRAIVIKHPTHPHAELGLRALTIDGAPPSFTPTEQVQRAEALIAAGRGKAALSIVEALAGLPPALSSRAALVLGQALLGVGRDQEGLAALDRAAALPQADVASAALLLKARKLMRAGDNPGARKAFLLADERHASQRGVDEGAYLAAWIAMTSGETDTAVREFEAFEARYPTSRKRDEARWFRAWTLYRAARFADASAVMASLAGDFPRSSLAPQAKYWAVRCTEQLAPPDAGVFEAARKGHAAVIAAFPATFYAALSRERLLRAGASPEVPFTQTPVAKKVALPAPLKLAAQLAQAGLLRDASEEIEDAVKKARGADAALTWGHALQAQGEFGVAHALASRYLWGAAFGAKSPEALMLMYPRAYAATVEGFSAEVGLDPFFTWAIMRRESAFRPEVSSAADARGLMQIIPPTSKAIAQRLGIEPVPSPDELYGPGHNVRFGTWYLKALLDRMGHPALAAGSYNAGPSAVAKWVAERGSRPLDEWVEEIPYRETRGYVKQVLADYVVYQQLYGKGPPARLILELPTPKATGVSF